MAYPEYFKFKATVGGAPFKFVLERCCRSLTISGPSRGKRGEKEAQAFLTALAKFADKRLHGGQTYRGTKGKEKIDSLVLDLH